MKTFIISLFAFMFLFFYSPSILAYHSNHSNSHHGNSKGNTSHHNYSNPPQHHYTTYNHHHIPSRPIIRHYMHLHYFYTGCYRTWISIIDFDGNIVYENTLMCNNVPLTIDNLIYNHYRFKIIYYNRFGKVIKEYNNDWNWQGEDVMIH